MAWFHGTYLVCIIRKEYFMEYLCCLALDGIHFHQMWWVFAGSISDEQNHINDI